MRPRIRSSSPASFAKLPAAPVGVVARPCRRRRGRLRRRNAHVDERGAVVVGAPGAQRLHQVGRVVLAVLRHVLAVCLERRRVGYRPHPAERAPVVGPFQVVLDVPVGARVRRELGLVAPPVAQEERDAVVGARDDQRDRARPEARRRAAAQPVGEDHRVVRRADLVDLRLEERAEVRRVVVEAAPVQPDVHHVRRARRAQVDGPGEDLAGQGEQAHRSTSLAAPTTAAQPSPRPGSAAERHRSLHGPAAFGPPRPRHRSPAPLYRSRRPSVPRSTEPWPFRRSPASPPRPTRSSAWPRPPAPTRGPARSTCRRASSWTRPGRRRSCHP